MDVLITNLPQRKIKIFAKVLFFRINMWWYKVKNFLLFNVAEIKNHCKIVSDETAKISVHKNWHEQ